MVCLRDPNRGEQLIPGRGACQWLITEGKLATANAAPKAREEASAANGSEKRDARQRETRAQSSDPNSGIHVVWLHYQYYGTIVVS